MVIGIPRSLDKVVISLYKVSDTLDVEYKSTTGAWRREDLPARRARSEPHSDPIVGRSVVLGMHIQGAEEGLLSGLDEARMHGPGIRRRVGADVHDDFPKTGADARFGDGGYETVETVPVRKLYFVRFVFHICDMELGRWEEEIPCFRGTSSFLRVTSQRY